MDDSISISAHCYLEALEEEFASDIVFVIGRIGRLQCLPECHQFQLVGGSFWNMHGQSSKGGNQQLFSGSWYGQSAKVFPLCCSHPSNA